MAQQSFKQYAIPAVLTAAAIGTVLYGASVMREIEQENADIKEYQQMKKDAMVKDETVDKKFDKKAHQATIKARTVSAKQIGERAIQIDDALTAFYKTSDPLPQDEAAKKKVFATLKKNQEANTRLTGAGEADHIKTWKLNPDWKTSLATIVTYQDAPSVPILFDMKTSKGKEAGVIYATFNTESSTLSGISKHYTTDGLADAAQVGGM